MFYIYCDLDSGKFAIQVWKMCLIKNKCLKTASLAFQLLWNVCDTEFENNVSVLLAFTSHFTWSNCFLYTNPEFERVSPHLVIWFATQHYILNEFPYDVSSFIFPDFLVFLSFAFLIHFFLSLCPSTTINVTIQRTRLICGLFSHSLWFGFTLKAAPLLGFYPTVL